MSSPPIDLANLDREDRAAVLAAYQQAGSQYKLAAAMARAGVPLTRSGVKDWLQRLGITQREAFPLLADEEDSKEAIALRELLDYLKSRPVPTGRPSKAKVKPGKKYGTELIGCDLQYPFHHEAAWEVFLALAEVMQPDGITLNGDTLDFPYLSHFRQNPLLRNDMQADIDECQQLLARVNAAAPDARKIMTVGNHDVERFINYLADHAPVLMRLRVLQAFDGLLGLDELGWELSKEGYWLIDRVLRVSHGTAVTNTQGGGSGQSAKKEMLMWGCAGVTGHTHKLGSFYRIDPISYRVWHEGGCLCDQEKMRKARVTTHKPYGTVEDWHLGCVKVTYSVEGESYIIDDIPIIESRGRTFCIYHDEEISA